MVNVLYASLWLVSLRGLPGRHGWQVIVFVIET